MPFHTETPYQLPTNLASTYVCADKGFILPQSRSPPGKSTKKG